jgi:ABC-type branched-subunit amino acid transport system permease subunit
VAGSLSVLVDRTANASNPLTYFQYSIEFLIAVVIGGTATIAGPFLGAALLVAIRRQTDGTEAMAPALLGGALIIAIYVLPDGIVGGARRLWRAASSRTASGGTPPPEAAAAESATT